MSRNIKGIHEEKEATLSGSQSVANYLRKLQHTRQIKGDSSNNVCGPEDTLTMNVKDT